MSVTMIAEETPTFSLVIQFNCSLIMDELWEIHNTTEFTMSEVQNDKNM